MVNSTIARRFASVYGGQTDRGEGIGSGVASMALVVGSDDEKSAWRIKNTWAPNWGDHGYMWVRDGENGIGYDAVWAEMSPTVAIGSAAA